MGIFKVRICHLELCSTMLSHLVVSYSLQSHACQVPLSMGFSKQKYWSELPFPSSGDLPDPGIEPVSPELAGRFFTSEPPGKPPLRIALYL